MDIKLLRQYYEGDEYLSKLRERVKVLKTLNDDPYARAAKIMQYATDPILFIEDQLFYKADKFDRAPKPFFLWPYQKKLILKMQEMEMGEIESEFLVDKPREMGITWVVCAYLLWRWLFTPNWSALIMSRTEEEVDNGTRFPDKIFGKIRWNIDLLPQYLIPRSYRPKTASRGTSTDMNLKLLNLNMGSALLGASASANQGRSLRTAMVYIDEVFYLPHFIETYNSIQSVAKTKVFTSTVVLGKQYEDFQKALEKKGDYMSLSWKDHPFKTQQSYDEAAKKAEEMENPELMREYEVSYALPERAMYYPEVLKSRVEPIQYIGTRPLYIALDIGGRQDLTVFLWAQFDGASLYILEAIANRNKQWDWYLPFLCKDKEPNPAHYNQRQLDMIKTLQGWNKPVIGFGEAAHSRGEGANNESPIQFYAKNGFRIMFNPYAIQHPQRRHATTQFLPRTVFNSNSGGVMRLHDAISRSRYSGSVRSTSEQLKPVHDDEVADYRSAFENLCVNIPRVFRLQRDDMAKGNLPNDFTRSIIKRMRI